MLKEKLLSYIKEQTKQADFDHVDKSCTADEMSGIFTVKRNTVSHYLNKEVGNLYLRSIQGLFCFLMPKCLKSGFLSLRNRSMQVSRNFLWNIQRQRESPGRLTIRWKV